IEISGRVIKWSKPAANAKVSLYSNKGGFFMIDTITNKDGRFAFKNLLFADSTKFVVQSKVPKGQDAVTLEIDTVSPPGIKSNTPQSKIIARDVDMSAYLTNQKRFYEEQEKYGLSKGPIVLKEVKVRDIRIAPIPHSQNLNGSGNADYVFTSKDIEKMICARLSDCLSGRIPRVRFVNGVPEGMAIMIDGNYVDGDVFTTLNPDDIEGIEV